MNTSKAENEGWPLKQENFNTSTAERVVAVLSKELRVKLIVGGRGNLVMCHAATDTVLVKLSYIYDQTNRKSQQCMALAQ